MNYKLTQILFVLISCTALCCHHLATRKERKTAPAFYSWKSVFAPTGYEKKVLEDLEIHTLYMKFFDVDWDDYSQQPLPAAQVRINDTAFIKLQSISVIPVIFISNACIQHIDSLQAIRLGENISTLVNNICLLNDLYFSELQIDCDWTASTKEKYFTLLERVKNQLKEGKKLSVTIRLYQIKYSAKTGIPPADRGLLMAYNMGDLKDPSSGNSILETNELKKYISALTAYPLPLDVGLPLFEWNVLFRNNSYAGLIENLPGSFFKDSAVKNIAANRYRVLHDTILNGYSFFKGDILRREESSYDELLAAEKIISENLSTADIRLSLFHLDSLILKKYSSYEMQTIFNGLR